MRWNYFWLNKRKWLLCWGIWMRILLRHVKLLRKMLTGHISIVISSPTLLSRLVLVLHWGPLLPNHWEIIVLVALCWELLSCKLLWCRKIMSRVLLNTCGPWLPCIFLCNKVYWFHDPFPSLRTTLCLFNRELFHRVYSTHKAQICMLFIWYSQIGCSFQHWE